MSAVELFAADDPRVETIWRAVEARGATSYFVSWGWVEAWLATLPADLRPVLAVLGDGKAAAWFGRRRVTRHRLITSRAWFLQQTGVPRYDELCVERVGAVGEARALGELIARLPPTWDEIVLPGVDREIVAALGQTGSDHRIHVDRAVAAPYVDLARVRASSYPQVLGASTRAQLRRAQRGLGAIAIEVATEPTHAIAIYDELVQLHGARWRAVGVPGAFADPWFDAFHRRLIAHRLASGEIQLMRVRADDRTIGCLYNFVYQGRVAFYQCGLAAPSGPHDKPGFVTHAAAIEQAAGAGHAIYDFLAGDARYKHNLSTDVAELVWARLQRPLARFAVENWLQARVARLRGTAAAAPQGRGAHHEA